MTIEQLRAYGADVDEGLGRCFGNEALYLRLTATVPSEKNFGKLREAVAAGNLKEGFEAAHALKGVLANLSLTPLLKPVAEVTEYLRAGEERDYTPYLEEIEKARAALEQLG